MQLDDFIVKLNYFPDRKTLYINDKDTEGFGVVLHRETYCDINTVDDVLKAVGDFINKNEMRRTIDD